MAAGLVFPSLMLVGFIYFFSGAIRNVGTVSLPPVARGTVALLAVLLLEPQLARTLIAGLTGFLPAALLS